jgi:hypothetical protein
MVKSPPVFAAVDHAVRSGRQLAYFDYYQINVGSSDEVIPAERLLIAWHNFIRQFDAILWVKLMREFWNAYDKQVGGR